MAKRTTNIEDSNSPTTEDSPALAPKKRGRPRKIESPVEIVVNDIKNSSKVSALSGSDIVSTKLKKTTKTKATKTADKAVVESMPSPAELNSRPKATAKTKAASKKNSSAIEKSKMPGIIEPQISDAKIEFVPKVNADPILTKTKLPVATNAEKARKSNKAPVAKVNIAKAEAVVADNAVPKIELATSNDSPNLPKIDKRPTFKTTKHNNKLSKSPDQVTNEIPKTEIKTIELSDKKADTVEKSAAKPARNSEKHFDKRSNATDNNNNLVAKNSVKTENKNIQPVSAEKNNPMISAKSVKQAEPEVKAAPITISEQSDSIISANDDNAQDANSDAPRLSWRERNKLRRNRQRLKKKQRRLEAEQQSTSSADSELDAAESVTNPIETNMLSTDVIAVEPIVAESKNARKKRNKNKKNKQVQSGNIVPNDSQPVGDVVSLPDGNNNTVIETVVANQDNRNPNRNPNQRNQNRNNNRNQQQIISAEPIIVTEPLKQAEITPVVNPNQENRNPNRNPNQRNQNRNNNRNQQQNKPVETIIVTEPLKQADITPVVNPIQENRNPNRNPNQRNQNQNNNRNQQQNKPVETIIVTEPLKQAEITPAVNPNQENRNPNRNPNQRNQNRNNNRNQQQNKPVETIIDAEPLKQAEITPAVNPIQENRNPNRNPNQRNQNRNNNRNQQQNKPVETIIDAEPLKQAEITPAVNPNQENRNPNRNPNQRNQNRNNNRNQQQNKPVETIIDAEPLKQAEITPVVNPNQENRNPNRNPNQRNQNQNNNRNQQQNKSVEKIIVDDNVKPVEQIIDTVDNKVNKNATKPANQPNQKKIIEKSPLDELVENKLRLAKLNAAAAKEEIASQTKPEIEKAEIEAPIKETIAKKPLVKEQKVEPKKPKERPIPLNKSKLLTFKQKNDEFIKGFLGELEDYLLKELLIDDTSKVLIGVSGGVDSIVLMDAMAILAERHSFFLYVAHFNHKLREATSDIDESFVSKTCAEYNIPLYTANGRVKQYAEKNSVSIEMAARFLRYSFFERTTRNIKADYMATAHTADDSAETFMMNLLRGSGLTGLSGIASRRQFIKDVMLIRPFLNFKKADLIKYANIRKLEWHEDETNNLMQYTRNKVRHELLPTLAKDYNPAIIDVINRSAKLIQGADRIINNYVKVNLPNVCTDIQTEKFSIKVQIFQTFDEFLQGELIIAAFLKYFRMQAPPINTIDRIIKLLHSDSGAICEVSKSVYAIRDRNTIIFAKKQGGYKVNTIIDKEGKFKFNNFTIVLKEVEKKDVTFDENPNIEFFDYDLIPPILYLRNWQAGDSFTPMGMTGSMKVSDFLTNEKIPITDRQNVLVLANKIEIIAVAGKRISDKVKVSKLTKRYLKVEYRFSDK